MTGSGTPARPTRAGAQAFSYSRSLAPMMWVMVALGVGELLVVHFLVAVLWSATVAVVLTLATLVSIVWLVLLIRSFARLPVLISAQEVVLRTGSLKSVTVPRDNVAAVETSFPPGFFGRPGVLNLALLAYPNVALRLREPLAAKRGRAPVTCIAHRLDQPSDFVAALSAA